MRKNSVSQSGIFNPRFVAALSLGSIGITLGVFSLTATPMAAVARRDTIAPPISFHPGPLPLGVSMNASGGQPGMSVPPELVGRPRDPRNISLPSDRQIDLQRGGVTAASGVPNAPPAAGVWSIDRK